MNVLVQTTALVCVSLYAYVVIVRDGYRLAPNPENAWRALAHLFAGGFAICPAVFVANVIAPEPWLGVVVNAASAVTGVVWGQRLRNRDENTGTPPAPLPKARIVTMPN